MIKRKLVSTINIFLVITFMTLPMLGFAQGSSGGQSVADAGNSLVDCETVDGCNWTALTRTLDKVKDYGLQLAVMLSVIFIVYAGGLYLTSAGNASKRSQAKTIIQNVVIGFFLALAGWLIINTITNTLEVKPDLLPEGFNN